jgi:hypothetical protein
VSRDIHTAYHFSAGLQDAQIDRYQTTETLISAFNSTTGPTGILGTHGQQITELIKMVDANFAQRLYYNLRSFLDHQKQVTSAGLSMGQSTTFDLTLTPTEIEFWRTGVSEEGHGGPKAQIWEQVAYASKLVTSGRVRTVALEFDYVDIHGGRDEAAMRATGTQTALPLARLIQTLKNAGLYDRTVIAMYTTDGGRTPISDSYGSEGKNGAVLAGGRIRGGYYGDIRVDSTFGETHSFRYHMPDNQTGQPILSGTTGNDLRTSGASLWKTVAKATGIPSSVYNQFPDTAAAPELNYLLRL